MRKKTAKPSDNLKPIILIGFALIWVLITIFYKELLDTFIGCFIGWGIDLQVLLGPINNSIYDNIFFDLMPLLGSFLTFSAVLAYARTISYFDGIFLIHFTFLPVKRSRQKQFDLAMLAASLIYLCSSLAFIFRYPDKFYGFAVLMLYGFAFIRNIKVIFLA